MDGLVKRDPDPVLGSPTAPIPVEDIPLELLRIYPKPRNDDNVVNKAIYRQLIKQYIAENNDWPPELQEEFKSEVKLLEYRITKSTGFCCLHKIGRWMYRETTWARFWTLRVMFGPTACANQGWFEEFSRDYPMVMDDAPAGIVPVNFEKLFSLQEWTPEEPQMERWTFHSTNTTRYGKRKAVKVITVGRKRPKLTTSSNNGSTTAISTAAALEVKITMTAQDGRTNTALQGFHVNGSGPLTGNQQYNREYNNSVSLMEDAIKHCSELHQAQAEALKFLDNQMQMVKEEYSAKEKQLENLLAQERRNKDALEDRISRIEEAIKKENS